MRGRDGTAGVPWIFETSAVVPHRPHVAAGKQSNPHSASCTIPSGGFQDVSIRLHCPPWLNLLVVNKSRGAMPTISFCFFSPFPCPVFSATPFVLPRQFSDLRVTAIAQVCARLSQSVATTSQHVAPAPRLDIKPLAQTKPISLVAQDFSSRRDTLFQPQPLGVARLKRNLATPHTSSVPGICFDKPPPLLTDVAAIALPLCRNQEKRGSGDEQIYLGQRFE